MAGRFDCIYKRGLLRCHPTSKGQCEKPRKVGWQQIQIPALFFYDNCCCGESYSIIELMTNKVCIFVKGATGRGKSKSLVALVNKMGIANYSQIWTNDGADIRGVVTYMGKKIALCSDNKPNSGSVEWIKSVILEQSCDIIIVACRSGGRTQDPLIYDLGQYGYVTIEAYPFRKPNAQYSMQETKLLSTAFSESILNIITNTINNE